MSELPLFLREALYFQRPRTERLRALSDREWKSILSDWHVVRLTLPLRKACGDDLPVWVREKIDVAFAETATRFERIQSEYSRAADAIREFGSDHVVIKGFSLWPDYSTHPRHRPQSDVDLYCPPETALRARDSLLALGYSNPHLDHVPSDHLPTLVPPHNWKWQGNYFDPDIPISFELHHCWWDAANHRIRPRGLEDFWHRRTRNSIDGFVFPALDPVDNLGYTALNLFRHILKSFPATEQVYGLARFLHVRAADQTFWRSWSELHHESLRRLEAITFRLAQQWFDCRLAEEVQEEINRLPEVVHGWFLHFSESLLSTKYDHRKDGLWLQLSLLESRRDKCAVFFRRLTPVPVRVPTIETVVGSDKANPPAANRGLLTRAKCFADSSVQYAKWLFSRGGYHFAPLPLSLFRGLRYQLSRRNLSIEFWRFFAAAFCFDIGMTMYFFLFNVYLLDRGFDEKSLGVMLSLLNVGSIVSTIPAGILIQKIGIRKSLLVCIALLSAASVARALVTPRAAIFAFTLIAGFLTTIWAVAISPAVAVLTSERQRPFGFSVVFSMGIGVGILANLLSSRLPGYFVGLNITHSDALAKQFVLLLSSAVIALALLPLFKMTIPAAPPQERRVFPRNPFLLRFLPALALWSVVTGSLSPLANVYFSQYLHTPLARIGVIFSFSNLLQVIGVLIAPFLFRKLGIVSGIAFTQLVTAILLGLLAATAAPMPAAVIYVVFTGFLWMTEPGMFSLLMNRVTPDERPGASALNFLVISLVQAGSVALTGSSFVSYGYPKVLAGIAMVATIAAAAFWSLLNRTSEPAAKPVALNLHV